MGSVDKRQGALARREKRLAYLLLLPTFLLVFSIVLFPLIANFWISVKPVTLADLRPPTLVVKERLRGNLTNASDNVKIEYRFRNSSIKYPLSSASFSDSLPLGIEVTRLDPACSLMGDGIILRCDLGDLEPKARGKIRIEVASADNFSGSKEIFRASEPQLEFTSYNILTSFDFTFANFTYTLFST